LREIEQRAADAYRARFGEPPVVVASAPGRVNLLGEHTDYNGGFVLPCAIERRVAVALGYGAGGLYSVDHDDMQPYTGPRIDGWADYPHGVVWALGERGTRISIFQAAITGDVPAGAGLSSSAAIEAAMALALDAWLGLNIQRTDLALLCQRAENEFVKVDSGIMDQYASLLCQQGSALLIDCRSLASEQVPLDLGAAGRHERGSGASLWRGATLRPPRRRRERARAGGRRCAPAARFRGVWRADVGVARVAPG
jgi:galactokinase